VQVDNLMADKRIVHLWEAESALNKSDANVSDVYGVNASNGQVVNMPPGSNVWWDIEVIRSGDYRMAVRLNGSATVSIDDQKSVASSNELGFAYLDPIYLDKGAHSLELYPVSDHPCDLDVVWLYSTEPAGETIEDIFTSDETLAQITEYQKINPTKYRVKVSASAPFMLSLSEAYNEQWEARVNGRAYPSMPLNSVANGFWIEEEGELEITIEFRTQRWFYLGVTISAISIAGALAFLLWNWRRKRIRPRDSEGSNMSDTSLKETMRRIVERWRKPKTTSG
jgi:hypothetical protein